MELSYLHVPVQVLLQDKWRTQSTKIQKRNKSVLSSSSLNEPLTLQRERKREFWRLYRLFKQNAEILQNPDIPSNLKWNANVFWFKRLLLSYDWSGYKTSRLNQEDAAAAWIHKKTNSWSGNTVVAFIIKATVWKRAQKLLDLIVIRSL